MYGMGKSSFEYRKIAAQLCITKVTSQASNYPPQIHLGWVDVKRHVISNLS